MFLFFLPQLRITKDKESAFKPSTDIEIKLTNLNPMPVRLKATLKYEYGEIVAPFFVDEARFKTKTFSLKNLPNHDEFFTQLDIIVRQLL